MQKIIDILINPDLNNNPRIKKLLHKVYLDEERVQKDVRSILDDIRERGDQAVLDYIRKFDGANLSVTELRVTPAEIADAYTKVNEQFIKTVKLAINNLTAYHQKQLQNSWFSTDESGMMLGQLIRPIAKVGIYVPGGTASYPSSVLMNAIPAIVAGVEQIVMCTPSGPDGKVNPFTLVTADLLGLQEIYKVGGVQAIGALAYGTDSIPKVYKITGPGNIYVTFAKKMVYGEVDIDMLAGPSEILIIADNGANPAFLAADLLSQAEHDRLASAVLVTTSLELANAVEKELARQLAILPRREIARQSLQSYGAIIVVESLAKAIDFANAYAPEHLEVMVRNPLEYLSQLKNAGSIFLGDYTPEPLGDYLAGPNHVLPTGGTAKFYSALNVDTFMKKTSFIKYSAAGLEKVKDAVINFAEMEGLDAHARSVKIRVGEDF